jgi:DNA-binding CsgD family transcriptional regulator
MATVILPGIDFDLLPVLADIYDAAVGAGSWEVVAQRLAVLFAGGVALFAQQGDGMAPMVVAAAGFDSGFTDNPARICAGLLAWAVGMVARPGNAAAPPCDWQAGWLPPDGCRHATVVALAEAPVMQLAVVRPKCRGPLREVELARFAALIPHLRRGVRVCRQARATGAGLAVALAGFERFQAAALVVDGGGRILLANHSAERLLTEAAVLESRAGMLAALDKACDARLRAAIGNASATVGGAGDHAIALPRPAGRPPMALVTPCGGLAATKVALVLIRDCDLAPAVDAASLRAGLGLTAAEAKIVARLAAGATLGEIAAAHGIGIETIRSHLKRSMAKAEVGRQADLISLALRIAGFSSLPPRCRGFSDTPSPVWGMRE